MIDEKKNVSNMTILKSKCQMINRSIPSLKSLSLVLLFKTQLKSVLKISLKKSLGYFSNDNWYRRKTK